MVETLHPPRDWPAGHGVNDASVVLRVQWRGGSLLLPGDIEEAGETALSATDCRAAVLKAAHHGSGTSNSDALLGAVQPSAVVVSCGEGRQREPVDEAVLARLAERGTPVVRTDQLGGIRMRMGEDGARFRAARPDRGYIHPRLTGAR